MGFVLLFFLQRPDGSVHITACDVGQGDAILVTYGYTQVLVDGGPSEAKVLRCLRDRVPFWDRRIEVVVMTNSDFDHANGLDAVIQRYNVEVFVTGDGVRDSEAMREVMTAVQERGVTVHLVKAGEVIKITEGQRELDLRVLWPGQINPSVGAVFDSNVSQEEKLKILGEQSTAGDVNEQSVVLLLDYGDQEALLTGDIGIETERKILENNQLPDIEILKVGHHGSKYSTGEEWLQRLKPEVGIISVGGGNRYGHPAKETLGRMETSGVEIRRTDLEGDVELVW